MIFKGHDVRIIIRVALLFLTLLGSSFVIVLHLYIYLLISVPLIAFELADLLRYQKKAHTELQQLVESVFYRDFSRHFDIGRAPAELILLRQRFNDINATFKEISRERETQYHYLQTILELVDTGILSYEEETGKIGWLNESFKKMFGIPYLKSIKSLQKRDELLYNEVLKVKPGDSKILVMQRNKQLFKILLTVNVIRSDDKMYRLLGFQNINEALDETESRAWQKLLDVMTHEIMNSVAPISSLADTLTNRLKIYSARNVDNSDLDDLVLGINTIKRRSEGLLKFTESYRNLNKITRLDLKKVLVRDLFENLNSLMHPTLATKNIELNMVLRNVQMAINADVNLIEQVFINLLLNAIEAVKDRPEPTITLSAELSPNNKAILKIADNGAGMPLELIDKIFIPFFSTRKSGSGIGLSLCKQIMMLHKGNIQVQSVENEGSVFIISF